MHDPPLHVLLVEDDDGHAMIVEKGFRWAGRPGTIDRVCDGVEAVAYVKRQGHYHDRPRPHLILLDLKLPRRTGHEVLEWARGRPEIKKIPIVVLTSSKETRDINEAYDLGASSYLVKPVDFGSLLEVFRNMDLYSLILNGSQSDPAK